MLYPKPLDCHCGQEISWAACIESEMPKKRRDIVFSQIVCPKCKQCSDRFPLIIYACVDWNSKMEKINV
jgi:hypothetical protein